MSTKSKAELQENLSECAPELEEIFSRCAESYPDFGLTLADFRDAVQGAAAKYLADRRPSVADLRRFVDQLQVLDLYLALGCARGNEQAWWEFDRAHRAFIERWASHLARSGSDADEVIDSIYVELFGTKTVGGVRQSKFRSYTGRGTLRGWLRTVILHAAVDLYRGRKLEIPLEDWSGSGDETSARSMELRSSEELMLANVVRERYRSATIAALDQSLAALDDHETLLLLYYHVEGLKLREIARIVEEPRSPIRRWFQRRSRRREGVLAGRVHESTVMRWLEKVYQKVADRFHAELSGKHGLSAAEIEICKTLAIEDPAQGVRLNQKAIGERKELAK